MTLFEEKVNEYRENKRLLEELEAMNESIKADIICMMQGAHPDIYAECSKKTVYKRFSVA